VAGVPPHRVVQGVPTPGPAGSGRTRRAIRRRDDLWVLTTHALGFSLRSAIPLGEAFVEAIVSMLADLGGLLWSWRHTAGALIGALSGEDAGASSALPISSIERPFVSKPRNKKTSPAWPYQKARKSSAGKIASSVTFGLT
jgi:hypothetical protein